MYPTLHSSGDPVTLIFYPTEDMSEARLTAADLIKILLREQVPQPPVASGALGMKETGRGENISPTRDLDLEECLEGR